MSRDRGRIAAALAASLALGGLVGAGCGVEVSGRDKEAQTNSVSTTGTSTNPQQTLRPAARPNGIVDVNGSTRNSLTPQVVNNFNEEGVRLRVNGGGENQAFQQLCRGQIDVVDSQRKISKQEQALCARYGLQVVQLLVASDAVVVATKNEADVGGDCETVAQLRDAFEAGSTITNWRQLGFFNLPLTATGPVPGTPVFNAFARDVLGVPVSPSLSDFRRGYIPHTTDRGVRLEVINRRKVIRAEQRARAFIKARANVDKARLQRSINRAEARASRKVLRQIDRENARRKRLKQSAPANLSEINARRVRIFKKAARKNVLARYREDIRLRNIDIVQRFVLRADRPGVVGLFRFTYYENFEDQLRPQEIDLGVTKRRNCIFPSQQTITDGSYPLARRLLLYTTTRSLRRAEVKAFLRSYVNQAQSLATARRLVPLPDTQRREQLAIIAAGGKPRTPRKTTTTRTTTTGTTTTTTTTRTVTTPAQ
jgi:ABC-type phosphate transport system substrate-binding protein